MEKYRLPKRSRYRYLRDIALCEICNDAGGQKEQENPGHLSPVAGVAPFLLAKPIHSNAEETKNRLSSADPSPLLRQISQKSIVDRRDSTGRIL